MADRDVTAGRGGLTIPQILAGVIGAVYLIVGVTGFFVTGADHFAQHTNETLLGFEINPLHNIVHILVGALGLLMFRQLRTARLFGFVLLAGYGLTFLYGLWAAGRTDDANFLSLNGADNWLHLVSALAGAAIAFWPVHTRTSDHTRA
jgi:hypothetical protein